MRILDRYVVRETLPPFLLALALFTFVLTINPMLEYARQLLAKGVPLHTVGILLATLIPQAMSLTIPMAFLTGLLMALGRLSGDRESVALLACGVSPLRLLRPVLLLALVVAGLDMYILMKVKPDANQAFREVTFRHLTEHTSKDIRPRVFFEQFPGIVLYVGDTAPDGGWSRVLLADTTNPDRPSVTLAETGRLVIDREERLVRLILEDAAQYTPGRGDSPVYTVSRQDPVSIRVTAQSVFGSGDISRGYAEMSWADLRRQADRKIAEGISPHNEILHMQQMYSFPVACLVFAILGLALGLNTLKEGRLASLVLGLAVICAYFVLMQLSEAWVKGGAWTGGWAFPAVWARWVPNIVLGLVGVAALWWRARGAESRISFGLPFQKARRRAEGGTPVDGGRRAARPRAAAIVVRVPDLRLPGPRILDRYVGAKYLRIGAVAFAGLLALYYIGETVDLADKLFKGQADGWMLARYLWHATPQFVAYLIPIATLVAVLGTIGALTRSSELMVMRACGVSLYRAALPLVLLAVAWSGVLFLLEERVLGPANRSATTLRDTIRYGSTPHTLTVANPNWLIGDDGRVYHYALFEAPGRRNAGRATLHLLSIFEPVTGPYRLTRHTYAKRASFESGAWRAEEGWTQEFAGQEMPRRDFAQATVPMPAVADFQRAQLDASRMSYRELRQYVKRLAASGFNVAEQNVDLQRKIAFPAVTVVMTLLAIPFGVTTGRKGALYGIGLAVMLAAAYFLLMTFFLAVGAAGVLPAPLAAWAANLIFAAGAVYMLLTVRT